MFSDKYKKDNEKINLDKSFKENLGEKIKKGEIKVEKNNKKLKASIAAAAAMAIIVGGYFMTNGGSKVGSNDTVVKNEIEESNKPNSDNTLEEGIGSTSPMSFLRYDGKDYRYVFHNITSEKANELKGEKLGTTVAGDMNKEFASQAAGVEIYTMKGYDDKSVLLGILTTDTDIVIDVYNHYDDNEIKTGNDIVSKMKIEGNIGNAVVTNNMGEGGEVESLDEINSLIMELKLAENKINNESFMEEFYSQHIDENKSLNIELKDGIVRTFDFYKTGFVFIDGYVFELPNKEKALELYNNL